MNSRLGEQRIMKCGKVCTVIAYRNYKDIDVEFEDGYIAEHRQYGNFLSGNIGNPNSEGTMACMMANTVSREGEQQVMKNGMTATIIAYRGNKDIDIQFENGFIAKHKTYDNFLKGKVGVNNVRAPKVTYIGETRTMSCGMDATIIAYRMYSDIDVEFTDGYVAKNRSCSHFFCGKIGNPNVAGSRAKENADAKTRVGSTRIMNCGMKATIVAYRDCKDIDVQFEDGYLAEHKHYSSFINGVICHPQRKRQLRLGAERVGEQRLMKCGQLATVIAYREAKDIDIQFEDGTIVTGKIWSNFQKGLIGNPNILYWKCIQANDRR